MRNLTNLENETFDLLILGGGVTGAAILWDATLRGLSCLLLERGDYGHATSSATSKMAHGGLRYLKMMDFALVRESLRERKILQEIAPHQVRPLDFLLPTYKDWGRSRSFLWGAMSLYEALSYDKGDLSDPDQRLKPFYRLKKDKILQEAPFLPEQNLTGCFVYQDCQIHDPERLVQSYINGARGLGAQSYNYIEATNLTRSNGSITGVTARDQISGKEHQFKAKAIVNATGPWSDRVLGMLKNKTTPHIKRSKGIHILVPKLPHDKAIALFTKQGRHLFILPWQGMTLFGTTDESYQGDPDDLKVSEQDLSRFLGDINQALPQLNLKLSDIRYFYGGLRPMTASATQQGANSYNLSRKHEIFDHALEGAAGLYSATGGKFTTSRGLAEECLDLIIKKERLTSQACKTASTPLWGGNIGNLDRFIYRLRLQWPKQDPDWITSLVHRYGDRAPEILIRADGAKDQILCHLTPLHTAEVHYAMEQEQAWHLSDLLFRRLGIGNLGNPGSSCLMGLAAMLADKRGWSQEQVYEEARSCGKHFIPGSPLYRITGS